MRLWLDITGEICKATDLIYLTSTLPSYLKLGIPLKEPGRLQRQVMHGERHSSQKSGDEHKQDTNNLATTLQLPITENVLTPLIYVLNREAP